MIQILDYISFWNADRVKTSGSITGDYCVWVYTMVKSSSFKENRNIGNKYKLFFLLVGWPWAALLNFLWPDISLPTFTELTEMLSEFNLRVEHLAQIQPREHLLDETDCGYYNDTIFMIVWNIVTMIFIIIINLGYSRGREKQLTNIRLRIRAC